MFWSLAFVVFLALVIVFKSVLFPFVLGALIAYLLNPAVLYLSTKGVNRQGATLLILGTFILVFAGLIAVTLPILVREAGGFIQDAPGYVDRAWKAAQPWLESAQARLGFTITPEITDQIQGVVQENITKTLGVGKSVVGGLLGSIALGGQAVLGFIATLFLTPIVAFFMMKDWPQITSWTYGLVPRHMLSTVKRLLGKIDVKIAGFIRGQLTVCFVLGMMYAIALSIAGLNYGFFIGLGTGLLSIIPYAGTGLGLIISLGVAALQSGGDITYIAIIGAIFAAGQFIEGNFITPKLIGDSVGLHPLWIIFALLAGGSLLGLVGMILAIPVAAIISVLLGYAIQKYKESPYYKKAPEDDEDETVTITIKKS